MPTNVERLATLEEKVDNVAKDVGEIKKSLENLDTRFASKLTQTIVYGLCAMVLVLFFKVVIEAPVTKEPQQTVTITTQNPDGTTTTRIVPVTGNANSAYRSDTPSGDTGASQSGSSTTPSGNSSQAPQNASPQAASPQPQAPAPQSQPQQPQQQPNSLTSTVRGILDAVIPF